MRDAVIEARRLADLPEDAAFVELPEEDDSLLGFLLDLVGLSAAPLGMGFMIPPAFLDVARALAPFMVFDPGQPMARADIFEVADYPLRLRKPDANDSEDEDLALEDE